jgi:hypothetical protein
MQESALLYAMGSVLVVVAIILLMLGLENIIKIILGNYILGTICFSVSLGIDNLIVYLQGLGDQRFAWFAATWRATFFANWHATIVLLLYILLLFVLYKKSTISIRLPSDSVIQKTLYIFFIPLALTSVILTLYILLRGSGIISPAVLADWSASSSLLTLVAHIFSLTPLWIAVHGIATLLITAEIPMRVETDLSDFTDI